MTEDLQAIHDMTSAWLSTRIPTPDMIREHIGKLRLVYPDISDGQAEALAKEFEAIHDVDMAIGSTLEEPGFEKWLEDERENIKFFYWNRYRRLLVRKGFSSQVLATLDQVTDRTLGLLQNPRKKENWDRRGMVVGHVQSGKTANYTGLICKAADAGYEVIIVIAGIHNNLRSQTQVRIDEGLIGIDSSKMLQKRNGTRNVVGVGNFDHRRRPNAFTNTLRDFNKATATSVGIPLENLKEPAVFVIKKNSSTLAHLLEWLTEHNARRGTSSIAAPMLLIDDEADNASINIKKGQEEVSRINGQIRQLLKVFDRSCYVGYTATPFANILIDPTDESGEKGEDLFPRDFIVSLDPPDNYFGPSRVFSGIDDDGNGSAVVRHIEDNGDLLPVKHRIDHDIEALPASLEDAVRAFVLAKAIRLARGQAGKHNSMLVNASRFTSVQRKLKNEIHLLVDRMRSCIRVNGATSEAEALGDPEIAELKHVFDEEYASTCQVVWRSVQKRLWQAISPIKVIEVNSRSSDTLDYTEHEKSGLNVIAVGGFSLSRGLTLEGLVVSYFLRNSMMYDTLMQMGRWFGYRPGYDDLCRIWMPEEAEGWYAHIADSIDELREEFRQMEVAGATPSEFGLKVRSHPDNLIVTARNKMGAGEQLRISIGLANQFVETTTVPVCHQAENRMAAVSFASTLANCGPPAKAGTVSGNDQLFCDVDVEHILAFLRSYRNASTSTLTQTGPLVNYISRRAVGELAKWKVYVPYNSRPDHVPLKTDLLGYPLTCQRRKEGKRRDPSELRITNNQRVASRGVEKIGLTAQQRDAAEAAYRKESKSKLESEKINYPDKCYRDKRVEPLLILHLLAIGEKGQDLSLQEPVVAWSISFPGSKLPERTVEYVVNTTWFRERFKDEGDDDDADGDE